MTVQTDNVQNVKLNFQRFWMAGYNWLKENGFINAVYDASVGTAAPVAAEPLRPEVAYKNAFYPKVGADGNSAVTYNFAPSSIASRILGSPTAIATQEYLDYNIYGYPFGAPTRYGLHTDAYLSMNILDMPLPGNNMENVDMEGEVLLLPELLAIFNRFVEPNLGFVFGTRDVNDAAEEVWWPWNMANGADSSTGGASASFQGDNMHIVGWCDMKYARALKSNLFANVFFPQEGYWDRLSAVRPGPQPSVAQTAEYEEWKGLSYLATADPTFYRVVEEIQAASRRPNTGIPFPVILNLAYGGAAGEVSERLLWNGAAGDISARASWDLAMYRLRAFLDGKYSFAHTVDFFKPGRTNVEEMPTREFAAGVQEARTTSSHTFIDRDFALQTAGWRDENGVAIITKDDELAGWMDKVETNWDSFWSFTSLIGDSDIYKSATFNDQFHEVFKALIRVYKHIGILEIAEDMQAMLEEQQQNRAAREGFGETRGEVVIDPEPVEEIPKAVTVWDQQCFLIENIRSITAAAKARRYPNIANLSAPPGNIVSQLQHGDPKTNNTSTEAILNLTPAQHALLVPYIRLYRVIYDKEDPLLPKGQTALPFKSHTEPDDIKEMLDGKIGRQAGAGLKSFEWTLQGVQPAEVDNNIVATLTVHFQSMYDLFRPTMEQIAGGKLKDWQAGLANPAFLDLIMAPETIPNIVDPKIGDIGEKAFACFDNPRKIYDGVYYRIKAVVGWAIPDEEAMRAIGDLTSAQVKQLNLALINQRTTLFLQLARHEIDINDDGSVTLVVNYQGALSGIMRSQRADLLANKAAIENPFSDPNSELSQLRAISMDEKKKLSARQEAKYEKLLNDRESAESEDKIVRYRRLLGNLFKSGLVNTVRVPMSELLLTPWKDLSPKGREERAKKRQGLAAGGATGYTINPGGRTGLNQQTNPLYLALENVTGPIDSKTKDQLGQSINTIQSATPEDVVDIHYMYLGDLISSVLEQPHLKKQLHAGVFSIFLGTLELVDPLVAYSVKNIHRKADCEGLRKIDVSRIVSKLEPLSNLGRLGIVEQMLISHIPISLNAFNEWFLQNVIKKDRVKYYLDFFVKDILAGLVSQALGPGCFPGIPYVPTRFAVNEFVVLDGHKFRGKTTTLTRARRAIAKGEYRLGENLRHVQSKGRTSGFRRAPSGVPSLFVYSTDSLPQAPGLDNPADDLAQGIYHFYLGASSGLVKKITFNRQDQPYLREAKIQRQGTLGPAQLREYYGATLNMVGNTLLKNGQYIFINPSLMGLGSPQSRGFPNLARMLGLGGYFLVTGVTHRIDENGFSVTAEALHEAMRKPDAQTTAQEETGDDREEEQIEEQEPTKTKKKQEEKKKEKKKKKKAPTKKPPPTKEEIKRYKEREKERERKQQEEKQREREVSLSREREEGYTMATDLPDFTRDEERFVPIEAANGEWFIYDRLLEQYGRARDPSQTTGEISGFYDPFSGGQTDRPGSFVNAAGGFTTDLLEFGGGGRGDQSGATTDAYNPNDPWDPLRTGPEFVDRPQHSPFYRETNAQWRGRVLDLLAAGDHAEAYRIRDGGPGTE